MKKLLGALVVAGLLASSSWAGDMTAVSGLTGGTGFCGLRLGHGDNYTEWNVGPVGLSSSSYTVGALMAFPFMGHTMGASVTYASTGTTSLGLVMRHEMPLTNHIGLGISGTVLTSSGGSTTLFNGSSVYATIDM